MQTKGAPTTAHDSALANARGNKRGTYTELNTIVADVPLNQVATLAARSDVAYIAPDRPFEGQFNLTNDTTGATQAQNGFGTMPDSMARESALRFSIAASAPIIQTS